jgi:hypothetical protein
MGSSMSGHTKQAYISHCKTTQMAENLKAKDAELQQAQWLIEEYKQIAAQDAKSLKQCKHDFRWMITIALGLGFTIGFIAKGIIK